MAIDLMKMMDEMKVTAITEIDREADRLVEVAKSKAPDITFNDEINADKA